MARSKHTDQTIQNDEAHSEQLTRRAFIRIAAVVGAGVVVAACSEAKHTVYTQSTTPPEASRKPVTPETTTTIKSQQHRDVVPQSPPKKAPETTEKPVDSSIPSTTFEKFPELPVIERVNNNKFGTISFNAPESHMNGLRYNVATETMGDDHGPELMTGVGWEWAYNEAVQPGEVGNAVIFGHRTTEGADRFRFINELTPESGATFDIAYDDGQVFTFKVIQQDTVDADDVAVIYRPDLEALGLPEDTRMATLYACDPIGSSEKRRFVRGILVPNAPVPE